MNLPDTIDGIGWILSGDRTKASSRLQGFNIHEALLRRNIRSEIIASNFADCAGPWTSEFLRAAGRVVNGPYSHIVFEGPEWVCTQLAMLARASKKRAIAVRCDRYPAAYDQYYDLTILPTQSLRDELQIQRAAVIADMIEVPESTFKIGYEQRTPHLHVSWVGHQGYAEFIHDFIRQLSSDPEVTEAFRFETISAGPSFSVQWREDSIQHHLLAADIAIIPIPAGEWFKSKSANRLSMMFALGLPCVVTPISSYRELGVSDENVLFADDVDGFKRQLLRLRDASLREKLGSNARRSLSPSLRRDAVAQSWLEAINSVPAANQALGKPGMKIRSLVTVLKTCGWEAGK